MDTLRMLIPISFLLLSLFLSFSPSDIIHSSPSNSLIYLLFFSPVFSENKGALPLVFHTIKSLLIPFYISIRPLFYWWPWRFAARRSLSRRKLFIRAPQLLSYSFSHSHSVHRFFFLLLLLLLLSFEFLFFLLLLRQLSGKIGSGCH